MYVFKALFHEEKETEERADKENGLASVSSKCEQNGEREREEEKKVSSRANVLSEFGYNCKIQSNQIVQNATSILVNFLTVIP